MKTPLISYPTVTGCQKDRKYWNLPSSHGQQYIFDKSIYFFQVHLKKKNRKKYLELDFKIKAQTHKGVWGIILFKWYTVMIHSCQIYKAIYFMLWTKEYECHYIPPNCLLLGETQKSGWLIEAILILPKLNWGHIQVNQGYCLVVCPDFILGSLEIFHFQQWTFSTEFNKIMVSSAKWFE